VRASPRATFYLYFRSKDHVLDALRERYVERFLAAQAAAVARVPADDWPGRIEAWAVAGIENHLSDLRLHDVVFRPSRPPTGTEPDHTTVDAITARLEDGIAAGAFRLPDPNATATVLYYAVHGVADHLIHADDPARRARIVSEVRRICRTLLGSSSHAKS
jgi:AcrR family transcriptional regulator